MQSIKADVVNCLTDSNHGEGNFLTFPLTETNCKSFIQELDLIPEIYIYIACPSGPSVQTISMKKTKHLELSDSSWILHEYRNFFVNLFRLVFFL